MIFASIKRLAKHSAVYGIGYIISRFMAFLLLPLYTHFLSREEMGVTTIMFTYLAIFTILYTYGLNSAFLRFYIMEESEQGKKRIFSTAFLTSLISSFCFSAVLYVAAAPAAALLFSAESHATGAPLTTIVRYGAAILFCDSLAILPFLVLRAEERSGRFVLFKSFNVVSNIVLNVVLVALMGRKVEGVFLANVISSALTLAVLMPLVLSRMRLTYSRSDLRELLAFGLPYMPSTLSVVILDTIDRPLLERLAGVDVAGLFGAGARIAIVMNLLVSAFSFAWHPFFLSTVKEENAKEIFSKVLTYLLVVCCSVFLVVSLLVDHLVRLRLGGFTLFEEKFWDCTAVVPVLMLAYIPYAAHVNFLIGIYLEKKTGYLPLSTGLGMAGNLAANFLLIPAMGMMGAAWARVIAYTIMALVLYPIGQRLYPVPYEFGRIAKLAVVVAAVFFAGTKVHAPWPFLYHLLLLALFPVLLKLVGFFDTRELAKLRSLLGGARRVMPRAGEPVG
ncbi:MAG: oligosaccharide flippase family protein [candidate division KSB1 bacterium]|nr:oligosaccharide flippase family protein [candidate division KSB1 bacterium]MDZ7386553.1 oligosaccharide flippase family protein [candidate division KSB1 bacterium]MDZ7392509.1 oligosaccharide flippase family protein [candidate division KSB1 bacterium]MDZ7413488.1 oligosaccharide flippase family protein [candidate division KSB1 bacterium]